MQDIHEVLKEKEAAIQQLRDEIEALRLVYPLLDESSPTGLESGTQQQEETHEVTLADEIAVPLERIRARLLESQDSKKEEDSSGALLQFTKGAMGASRAFVNRVLDSPLFERETQRKTIRDFFERFARSNAA